MSERRRRRDRGFTLPELVITISLLGVIGTVIASAIVVTLRNVDDVEGRTNLADDEQSLLYDMPTDLASASIVDTDPSLTACGTKCPKNVTLGGSNVMLLTWTTHRDGGSSTDEVLTNVSYYFRPTIDTEVYQLDRVQCESVNGGAWTCEVRTVLEELPGPPAGEVFVPGDTSPRWVMQVSEPLAPGATSENQLADSSSRKDANRVVVTIHGNGGFLGTGGGSRQVSITAGGTTRSLLPPESVNNAPTFFELPGRCGGPVAVIVDNSELVGLDKKGSAADRAEQLELVRQGLKNFIIAFAGTPTRLQVITYGDTSSVLDPGGGDETWTRYIDMTNRDDVAKLYALVDTAITGEGAANWEDALFRAFFRADSTVLDEIPRLTVFFTAGFPNTERLSQKNPLGTLIDGIPPAPPQGWPTYDASGNFDPDGTYYSNGVDYSQLGFDRADWIADRVRSSSRIVGISVEKEKVEWVDDPGARYDYEYQRGWRQYQRATRIYEYHHQYYQRLENGNWSKVSDLEYYYNNTTDDESDGWRIRPDSDKGWEVKKESYYIQNNITDDDSDGWRVSWDVNSWQYVTEAEYLTNNTTPDESDGYRDMGFEWVIRDQDAMDWVTITEANTGDGYRYSKVYDPNGRYAEDAKTSDLDTKKLVSRFIVGNDKPVKGDWDSGEQLYKNYEVAELYEIKDKEWNRVPVAMRSAAASACGGTVTVSTWVDNAFRAEEEFTFQTTSLTDHNGKELKFEPTVVMTTASFPARTFDFDPKRDKDQWVTIVPSDLANLNGYEPAATPWSCWSGLAPLGADGMETVTIPDVSWYGVRVRIRAEEAVSCQLNVTTKVVVP